MPDQGGVDPGLFRELQFVVVLAGAHGEGNGGEHDRRGDALRFAPDGGGPDDGAGREVAGVDAAVVGELEDLGAEVARGPRGDDVLLAVRGSGSTGGSGARPSAGPGLEGMRVGQVNGALGRFRKAQHGVCSGDGFETRQPFPELLGAMPEARWRVVEVLSRDL